MGGKALRVSILAVMTLANAVLVHAQPAPPKSAAKAEAPNRVFGYTAWDDDFLYLAVQVNKPTITAKNKEPFSQPLEDDAIIVSLQTDGDHKSKAKTPRTYTLAISAAGGFQLYSGETGAPLFKSIQEVFDRQGEILKAEKDPVVQQQKILAIQGSIIKAKVLGAGAERSGGGNSPGYTAEVAIPWADLGGKPNVGNRIGFNLAVQSKSIGSPVFQSLINSVKSVGDASNPSLLGEMVFSNAPAPSAGSILVCPRVFNQKPAIDGEVASNEWSALSRCSFGEMIGTTISTSVRETAFAARIRLALEGKPARVSIKIPDSAPLKGPLPQRTGLKLAPTVFARFDMGYQGDSRKAAPPQRVVRQDLSTLLAHHPMEGEGPWFSYDRVDWHRKQLSEMRQEGIDVVAPVYRAGNSDKPAGDKALLMFREALRTLKQTGESYPQVALSLDTDSLNQNGDERLDLRKEDALSALYAGIRDFYRNIPSEFRFKIAPGSEPGSRSSCVVFLSNSGAFSDFDGSLLNYLRGRFLQDFDCDLIVIGESGFKSKAKLDGYFGSALEGGVKFDELGGIKTATLSPGYDSVLHDGSKVLSRRADDIYRDAWKSALAKHPDLILLESWNDFETGAEIAPSIETGFNLPDLTKLFSRAFSQTNKIGVKYLANDIPAEMAPGEVAQVRIQAQNSGFEGWGIGLNSVGFYYRWRKDGQIVGEGKPATLSSVVTPGQNFSLNQSIASVGTNGKPLSAGDYQLEILPILKGAKESTEKGANSLVLPVRLQASLPEWKASVIESDLPSTLESGSAYSVTATLRNDGSATWKKSDGVLVSLKLSKTGSDRQKTILGDGDAWISASDASVALSEEVAPGQTAVVKLQLPLIDEQGTPLKVWKQGDSWNYAVRWAVAPAQKQTRILTGGDAPSPQTGCVTPPIPIGIHDFEFGVRFTDGKTPGSLPADRTQPVSLSLVNTGSQTWKKDQVRIGYHWNYLDGTEVRWEDALTSIPADVPPGGKLTNILIPITAPPTEGTYYLTWDLKFGDVWSSTTETSRAFDTQVHRVQVIGKKMIFADLSKAFNVDGTSDIEDLTGSFDNAGNSFPAAMLPPYADAPVTPSGLWLASSEVGPESPRRINFRFGTKEGKTPNFISCKGQRVELGASSGPCRILHLVAASSGKDEVRTLRLIFQEPTSQSEDQYAIVVSRWDQPPTHGEETVVLCPKRFEKGTLKTGTAALYHYMIKIREPRKLVAVQLPFDPDLKIAAMTLEK